MFTTVLVLCCFCLSSLQAQSLDPFQKMKKNGVYVEPITPFLEKKELRFGYERMLKKNLSLNIGLGVVLKNEDPGYSEIASEEESSVFTRTGRREETWAFGLPTWSTTFSAPLPEVESIEEDSHFLRSHQFASAELKFFLLTNQKNKLPNGLYAAPGFAGGRQVYSSYHYSAGTRNQIEESDKNVTIIGAPPIAGMIITDWTETVTVFDYENRTTDTKTHYYLHPYLRVGYQLPIGRSFTIDLSGQLLFKTGKEAFPENPEFAFFEELGFGKKKELQKSLTLRMAYHF